MKISNGTSTHSPFPQRPILDSSKPKEFADEKFVFDEDGRQVSKWVENTMGKGEIARHEQFLHFPQCFQNTYTRKNQRLFGKGLRRTIVQKKKKSVCFKTIYIPADTVKIFHRFREFVITWWLLIDFIAYHTS